MNSFSKYGVRTGGEVDVRIDGVYEDIMLSPTNSDEVMASLIGLDHMRRCHQKVRIWIGYLPYGRADRVMKARSGDTEPNACVTFMRLLRSMAPEAIVQTLDAHNPRVLEAFNVINVIPTLHKMTFAVEDQVDFVIAPDAGASERARAVADDLRVDMVQCQKSRDASGSPTVWIPPTPDLTGKRVMIVDDIIDGGRTFVDLAQKLKTIGAASVILRATHSIFSNGIAVFDQHIDRIITTDSCRASWEERGLNIENYPQITVKNWKTSF